MNEFTNGKRLTSGFAYYSNAAIFIGMSLIAAMACASFGYNRIGIEGGLIAGCITLAVIIFELRNNRKHNKINSSIEWSLITIIVIFEVVVIGANFVAKTQGKETVQVVSEKAKIEAELTRLKGTLVINPKKNTDKYDNRITNETITAEKAKLDKLPTVIKGDEKEFYQLASEVLPFPANLIELIFNIGLGGLLVLSCMMLGGRVNSYYCLSQLKAYTKRQEEAIQVMFDSANFKPVNKSVPPESLKTQGTQEDKPKVIDKFNGQLEATREWVNEHPYGVELSTKEMRAMANTSKQTTQNAIIAELYDDDKGILTRHKKGNQWKYSRIQRDPKNQALNQIKETSNILSMFKK